jgi:hypothetical protein
MPVADQTSTKEVSDLERRLAEAADKLTDLSAAVGAARQIAEFNSDMRKRALAKVMTTFLDQGESAAAADAKARGSYAYGEEMKLLATHLREAETIKAEWAGAQAQFAGRSYPPTRNFPSYEQAQFKNQRSRPAHMGKRHHFQSTTVR